MGEHLDRVVADLHEQVAGLRQERDAYENLLVDRTTERDQSEAYAKDLVVERDGLRAQLAEAERARDHFAAQGSIKQRIDMEQAEARAEMAEGRLAATRETLDSIVEGVDERTFTADRCREAARAALSVLAVSDRDTNEGETPTRAELQAAIDRAYSALSGSAYVGGPTEREAFRIAAEALGRLATQHKGQAASSPTREDNTPDATES